MSIGAGGILRASLMLGLALGATTASAQTPANGTWTDPPARSAAPATPPPAAANPVAPMKEPAPIASGAGSVNRPTPARRSDTASRPETPAPSIARHAAAPTRKRVREARRVRAGIVAEAPRIRIPASRLVERRQAVRPAPIRVAAHPYAPRVYAAPPYPYAPLPVGRVAGPVDGERNPIFSGGDDRMRRIAAAQAAGYLVVRARSVQYPDGRMMRSYRAYEDDDGLD